MNNENRTKKIPRSAIAIGTAVGSVLGVGIGRALSGDHNANMYTVPAPTEQPDNRPVLPSNDSGQGAYNTVPTPSTIAPPVPAPPNTAAPTESVDKPSSS